MTGTDVFAVIDRFRAERKPFSLATVVRTADLTSAKAGAKAVVTADGEIIGHLGGGCVQGAVKQAAAEVLGSGQARMITVKPADAPTPELVDVDVHISGCPSGGTVDVFIEPYLQPLRLSILGAGPIAKALSAHGALMGYAISEGDAGQVADAVIIASQGAEDLDLLRTALKSPAPFVAMVASHRKAEHLSARLREEGMDPGRLAQLISPAGLDLGAIDPHEIAISILAQLISTLRNREVHNLPDNCFA